jgi:Uma2 family endonuclease
MPSVAPRRASYGARTSEVPDTAAFDLAPEWVAEVLSPSTAALDRVEKLLIYARENVPQVWLIHPRLQPLEAFALAGGRYQLIGAWRGAELARVALFEALELELAALWAR